MVNVVIVSDYQFHTMATVIMAMMAGQVPVLIEKRVSR